MISLLLRLLHRWRPREGWAPLLLLVVAVLCLPAALYEERDNGNLFFLATLAALVGLCLARSRLPARAAALLGTLLGGLMTVASVSRLWPPLAVLWREAGESIAWLRGLPGAAVPLSTVAGFVWQRWSILQARLWWWGQRAVATGQGVAPPGDGGNQDTIVLELLLAALVWGLSLLAGWQIYRRRAALAGLLPLGLMVTLVAFFRGGMTTFYFFTFLGCTLALVAASRLWRSRAQWEASGTDYPDAMGFELAFSLAPWVTVLLLLGFVLPVIQIRPAREAFWRVMDEPWSRVEQRAERLFGPIDSGYRPGRANGGEGGGLPQAHLLGGGPELGQLTVLTVATNDPPPDMDDLPPDEGTQEEPADLAPVRYWRGATYDTYTGQSWQNTPLESRPLAAYSPVVADQPAGFELVQQFNLLASEGRQIYAANAPYLLDQPIQAWWRDEADLAELRGEVTSYTVVSQAPQPTVAELRASSPMTLPLPANLASRYLALPETVPQRVLELAQEVAAEAPTGYDRARELERYLRTYTYNTDLPNPPRGRDIVDHFLFELQEGYCDYYASAMVVMARAVGVPARLATGYAQGRYDPDTDRWVVTEEDGHSWVEVYFEGIGWVEFEPTAGLPALARPGGEGEAGPVPALPPRARHWWQRVPWGLVTMVLGMSLLVGLIVWLWRPRPALSAGDQVRHYFGRLQRWGCWLRRPLQDGETPTEYGQALGHAVDRRGHDARWPQARRAAQDAPEEISILAQAYTQAQYGPQPAAERLAWQAHGLWNRLRRHLPWLWLTTRPRD
jgi:transglutaminase-like putative cysteine protease